MFGFILIKIVVLEMLASHKQMSRTRRTTLILTLVDGEGTFLEIKELVISVLHQMESLHP